MNQHAYSYIGNLFVRLQRCSKSAPLVHPLVGACVLPAGRCFSPAWLCLHPTGRSLCTPRVDMLSRWRECEAAPLSLSLLFCSLSERHRAFQLILGLCFT